LYKDEKSEKLNYRVYSFDYRKLLRGSSIFFNQFENK